MPTRSGRSFTPTPGPPSVAQSRRGPTSQDGRITRSSEKRGRADSDESLIELESEPKAVKGRPMKRTRAGKKKKNKPTNANVNRPQTIDLTGDDDESVRETSHNRAAKVARNRNGVEREAAVEHVRDRLARSERGVPAAMLDDTEVQPLWQVDLVGMTPDPSALTPRIYDEDTALDLDGDMPAYVDRTEQQSKRPQKAAPPPPPRIMFTYLEARHLMYEGGRNTTSQTVPPYTLSTGERVPFPVTKSYHLGAMGRYTKAPARTASCGSVVDGSAYVFDWGVHSGSRVQDVPRIYIASLLSSPNLENLLDRRRGLRAALTTRAPNDPRLASPRASQHVRTLPIRTSSQTPKQAPNGPPQASPPRHRYQPLVSKKDQRSPMPVQDGVHGGGGSLAQTVGQARYIFTFGPWRGKAITEAPMAYLRILERDSQLLNANPALSRAFDRHFPHGIFRYEVDNYRIDEGPYELRRLNEVPNAYIYDLEQDTNKVGDDLVLQHALKQRNRELGWSNSVLDATIRRYHRDKQQSNFRSNSRRF